MDHINLPAKKGLHYLKYFSLATFAVLFFSSLAAQTATSTLTGRVLDHTTKLPLAGATVYIKGSTHEVVTDEHGVFNFITAQKLPLTFSVTFIGYGTQHRSRNALA